MDDSQADQVYKWTIRALYGTAIALNVWMLWDAMDEARTEAVRARARALVDLAAKPLRDRKHFRRQVGHVIYEAMEIVDEARPTEADADG